MTVYDASGRWVRGLLEEVGAAGDHDIAWDLMDDAGRRVPAGLYFIRLEAEDRSLTQRVVTLR